MKEELKNACRNHGMDGWMDACIDAWMDAWIDGWVADRARPSAGTKELACKCGLRLVGNQLVFRTTPNSAIIL